MPIDASSRPIMDGKFGRPRRISDRSIAVIAGSVQADFEDIVYELAKIINDQEYAISKALDEIQGRINNVRTALALGRGLNDLGEFQGQTYAADVAIAKRENAWRMLAAFLPDAMLKKLRKGEAL